MYQIIYKPTGTIVSTHSTLEVAIMAVTLIETTPPSHEIIEVAEGE